VTVTDTLGITGALTVMVQENIAGMELALSFSVMVKGNVPAWEAVPFKVVVAPLEVLRANHDAPL
jgi:hypothetical protein